MTGLLGFSSGYHAMMNCDLLLMLGTDFPYRQFFPEQRDVVQVDIRGEQLGRRARLDHGFVGDVEEHASRPAPAPRPEQGRQASRGLARALPGGAQGPRRARGGRAGPEAHPSSVRRPGGRRARRDGRHLFLRRRHPDALGRALPHHEWQAAAARLLQPRVDGECPAAGHRGADQPSGPSGRLPVRRWRPGDADGRPAHAPTARAAGQARRLQERRARLRRAGDEGGRAPRLRHRPAQPRFRQDGRGGGSPGPDRRNPGAGPADDRAGPRA